jgi:hypothetical protein
MFFAVGIPFSFLTVLEGQTIETKWSLSEHYKYTFALWLISVALAISIGKQASAFAETEG